MAPAVLQINVGKMCNQVCRHCHVDAGPDRKEIMTRATMQLCLDALAQTDIPTVDLTGGAPEMNPDFRWFVERDSRAGPQDAGALQPDHHRGQQKVPRPTRVFQAARRGGGQLATASTQRDNTDRQRGDGVFADSIRALQMLNAVGYGAAGLAAWC
ncbi:MAG: hypothetical protein WKG07_18175 [Hymenobacter sp.]